MKNLKEFTTAFFGVMLITTIPLIPISWFIGEMFVNGWCAAPPPDMALDCVEQRLRAERVKHIILGGGTGLAIPVAIAVALSPTKPRPRYDGKR